MKTLRQQPLDVAVEGPFPIWVGRACDFRRLDVFPQPKEFGVPQVARCGPGREADLRLKFRFTPMLTLRLLRAALGEGDRVHLYSFQAGQEVSLIGLKPGSGLPDILKAAVAKHSQGQ